jgi:hypothetical protein
LAKAIALRQPRLRSEEGAEERLVVRKRTSAAEAELQKQVYGTAESVPLYLAIRGVTMVLRFGGEVVVP